jgi:uncharacterized membrane protein YraQ (UPF0718 family)
MQISHIWKKAKKLVNAKKIVGQEGKALIPPLIFGCFILCGLSYLFPHFPSHHTNMYK